MRTLQLGYQKILFQLKSLFVSIPLDKTNEITLQQMYGCNETTAQIPKKVMKVMLLLCTKEVHFVYSDGIY